MKSRFGAKPYYAFIPCIILFFVFCILPHLTNFYYALTEFNGITVKQFVGLRNFAEIFRRGTLWKATGISMLIAILVTVLQNVLAVAVAILVSLKVKGSDFFRSVYFFPTAMGIFACATVWNILLDSNYGQVTAFFGAIGIHAQFFGTTKSVYTVIGIQVWMSFGYAMTIYYAGIKSISSDIIEASIIDRATLWQQIRYIVLPMLMPSVRINLLLSVIGALQLRDIIFLTTAGGPMESSTNLPMLIYDEAFGSGLHGLAAAYNVILLVLILIVAGVVLLVTNLADKEQSPCS